MPSNTHTADSFSVRALARHLGVGKDKILAWIRKGELRAVNVAGHLSGRPQWRISAASVELFEKRRSSAPTPKLPRQRNKSYEVDYFPD